MKRKLGPLQLWQWIIIGAAVGVGTVLYRRGHPAGGAAQNAFAAATPSSAAFNPIDPTTGLPISGGVATAPASQTPGSDDPTASAPAPPGNGDGGGGLVDLLNGFGQLETLLAGLTQITSPPGPAVSTDPGAVQTQTGTKRGSKKKAKTTKAKAKKTTAGGHRNPGHHVTHHGGGRRTASSSAPHNPRQHQNVQSPSHQRHDPMTHHSAKVPARAKSGAGHTPASHPQAKSGNAAKREAAHAAATVTHAAPPVPAHREPPAKRRRR